MPTSKNKVAVAIPCYKVKDNILYVIKKIGPEVDRIYVIDDCCPENSGDHVKKNNKDKRVKIIKNSRNMGVGGATMEGYKAAIKDKMDIVVKLDGDGQMDPVNIPALIAPIEMELADYTKGNRFFNLDHLKKMPISRVIGNTILSFANKLSSGYWDIFDPTNGFTAIHVKTLKILPLNKIHKRYFFESDMLFRLNVARAVVLDIPMEPIYENEKSGLKFHSNIVPFMLGNVKDTYKRLVYNYYLRNFTITSIQLVVGIILLTFGIFFGLEAWEKSIISQTPATAGTVMVAALPIILGFQSLLSFLNQDIASVPSIPLIKRMKNL